MPKDRKWRRRLADDVRMAIERSSTHPVEYAIVLLVARDGIWHAVRTFDNAHHPEEHHEHHYIADQKQAPVVMRGPVNDAMHAAETKLFEQWSGIVKEWEATR